jgi:copper chaperone CopZ
VAEEIGAMERLTLTLPAMWADHHVLAVRAALADMPGVADTQASARDFTVQVAFDPTTTTSEAVAAKLAEAGYTPGAAPGAGGGERDDAAWAAGGSRTTTTNPDDAAMSGEHRNY